MHDLDSAAGTCACTPDNSENPEDVCTHNEIYVSKDFMNILETPLADIEINNLLAHEIGHAIAPVTKNLSFRSFDEQYSCLNESLQPDGYAINSKFEKDKFRGEATADYLVSRAYFTLKL